ncbi:restriction endonuclease subunit S [Agathobacter rectalis]|uniref:restriction endonuclease subunit S n=1 Tax=Agathobacter rectalis TaxID=39491 RepID=UPI0001CD3C6A|nr:restriction endonuclease subunit S [Agathobacter rectalis]CBK91674.1 Restriction endonuclease S subunits [Agathobacter rectalis DSM 17629]
MEYKKINELTTVVTGGTPSTRKNEYWDNGDIPWLQSGCCQNCDVDSTEKYITKEGYNNSSTHMMSADTVMIALTGATAGKVGYLKFEACGNQSITGILPCESLNQRYLFFYLLSQREKILADCVGGAQAHISQSYVKNMTIPILAIKEQEQIVGELTKVSNIVSLRQEEIQQLDNLVKARFVEMFGDCTNMISLSELCLIITDGTHQSPKFQHDGIPFILVSNLSKNTVTYDTDKFISAETYKELYKRTPIEIGDILLSTVGSYGHPAVVVEDRKFLFQRHIAYLKPKSDILNSYYMHGALLSPGCQRQIEEKVKGIAQKTLNLSEIRKIRIPVPSLDLQKQYADFVHQVNKSKVAVQKALDETQILFDSLMQKYFG